VLSCGEPIFENIIDIEKLLLVLHAWDSHERILNWRHLGLQGRFLTLETFV
jgi:hypothetical protein